MDDKKKYYRYLDILRIFLCISVLLYHLGILKGGFLAVCSFFVLSGFLSFNTADKLKHFSIFEYYKKRIIGIYIPLFIVVVLSVFFIFLNDKIVWLNLKPETSSVLLGYNNFWQISVNSDYFAHHVNSPFMHMWYISILLQFDLIFPFIYLMIKKLKEKTNKYFVCILFFILSVIFSIYFLYLSYTHNILFVYYDSLSRFFSILFGLSLSIIHSYKDILVSDLIKKLDNSFLVIIFYLYIIFSLVLFLFIDSSSNNYGIYMILISFITCRIIDYSTLINSKNIGLDLILKKLAGISYLVYLVQYPIIFVFQYLDFSYSIFYIIIFTILFSLIIKFALSFNFKDSVLFKFFKLGTLSFILVISYFGFIHYFKAVDHTKEMNDLKNMLDQNSQDMLLKQEEYKQKLQEEQDSWNTILSDLENSQAQITSIVSNLPVVGIGDSVMLGAVGSLYNKFPNGYFDAKVNRTDYDANSILVNLDNQGILGNPIVIHLGTNGQCGVRCRDVIMNTLGDRQVFLVNVTNDYEVNVNSDYLYYASTHNNVEIIDWYNASLGHSEYFYADGIHLNPVGQVAYADVIYNALYNFYLDEFNNKKNKVLAEHEELMKKKITFYGNDLLLNIFDELQVSYPDAKFDIDPNYSFDSLYSLIQDEIKSNSLNHKLVFAFDNSIEISHEQYIKLIELCSGHEIYIFSMNPSLKLEIENVLFINYSDEVKNKNYLLADRVHLNQDGNLALINGLNEIIK